MLSGMLVGALRVGAVLLTAGGLGTGVYFIAQVGDAEDASQLQGQATATAEAGQLSPPQDVIIPPIPTPTFPPAPTPPAIDTSDWLTYTSPLGFTIKYPPGWVVEELDSSIDPEFNFPRITKQHPEGTGEIVIEGGTVRLPPGISHAWIEIQVVPGTPAYPAEARLEGCQTEPAQQDRIREGSTTTLAGRPAGRCFTQELDRTGAHVVTADGYYVESPSGDVVSFATYIFDGDDEIFGLIRTMLATVVFET